MKVWLTYTGRRVGANEKTYQAFLHGKKEYTWRGITRVVIGYKYEAEKNGKSWTMSRRPTCGEKVDPVPEEWYALDLASEQRARQRIDETKKRRYNPVLQKLEPLRPLLEKLTYSDKRALLEYVLDTFTITTRPSTLALRRENLALKQLGRNLSKQLKKAWHRAESPRRRKS